MQSRPEKVARITFPYLTDIYLNFDNSNALFLIIDWLELPRLSRLSLPCIITYNRFNPAEDRVENQIPRLVNSTIQRHQQTLKEIVFLNMWQEGDWIEANLLRDLGDDWANSFMIQELVLSTWPTVWRFDNKFLQEVNKDPSFYKDVILKCHSSVSIKRLRIDLVHFNEELFDEFFTDLGFPQLKIIMLYPWPRQIDLHKREYPEDLSSFPEGRLALNLASQKIPNLQILVIGGYHFWIQRNGNSPEGETLLSKQPSYQKLWHLSQAQQDPIQRIEIDRYVSPTDWKFIQDLPPHPKVRDPLAYRPRYDSCINYMLWNVPSLQMLKNSNYAVLRREDDAGASLDPPPQRWLTHLAHWNQMWNVS